MSELSKDYELIYNPASRSYILRSFRNSGEGAEGKVIGVFSKELVLESIFKNLEDWIVID